MTTRAARERGGARGGVGVGVGASAGVAADGGPDAEPVRAWALARGPAPTVAPVKRMQALRWVWTGE